MKLPDEIYDNWIPFGGSVFRQKRCIVFRESLSLYLLFLMCTHGSSISWGGLSWNSTATFWDDIFCCLEDQRHKGNLGKAFLLGEKTIRRMKASLPTSGCTCVRGWCLASTLQPGDNRTNSWLCGGERWETTSYIFILLLNSLTWNYWPLDFLLDNKCTYCLNSS